MSNFPFDVVQRTLSTDGIRLFHGRGGCYPGWEKVNWDYYAPVLICQLFAPEDEEKVRALVEPLRRLLQEAGQNPRAVLLQRRFQKTDAWAVLWGTPPAELEAEEDGLRFGLSLMRNQNIGFFPDMRLGRAWVRQHAQNKRVLNLFAYTCSLAAAALAGGARAVVNMDLSRGALRTGRENLLRNGLNTKQAQFHAFDVMRSFGRMKKTGPYDLILIDPPSFQKGSFEAESDYPRIIRRLAEMTEPGAHIMACLNAPHLGKNFLLTHFQNTNSFTPETWLGRPPEFAEADPEKSLKIGIFKRKG